MGPPLTSRGEQRRAAVLDAALRCFRSDGFHSASIASICKEAGISAGHLYHFFPSKEAIVEAIVQGDRERMRAAVSGIADHPNLIDALTTALASAEEEFGFALDAALSSEIIAEAGRNPRIAAILKQYDSDTRFEIERLLLAGQADGQVSKTLDVKGMAHVLLVIGDGLSARSISDPDASRSSMHSVLKTMIEKALVP